MADRSSARRPRLSEYQTHLPRRLASDETGLAQDLEVVRDGRLALAQRLDEVADADLAFGCGGQDAEHPEPDRVRQAR